MLLRYVVELLFQMGKMCYCSDYDGAVVVQQLVIVQEIEVESRGLGAAVKSVAVDWDAAWLLTWLAT